MQENWFVYGEKEISIDCYEVIEIIQNSDGTRIKLDGEKHHIEIEFGFVDSLRTTDEGRRIRTYNEIDAIQTYRENFIGYPLYKVENSEYIQWIEKESAGFCIGVSHYTVMTENDIVDVISSFPPKIKST